MSLNTVKTSLSNQGYAIYKSTLTEKEIDTIKNDLSIKPFSCPGYGNPEDIEPYKLYKENEDKLYVPNFYGKEKFGLPNKLKINEPETTTLAFSPDRQMREYQKEIIKTYITSAKEKGGGIISVGCGRGKCLAKGTVIPLYNGTSKKVEELVEGDTLIGDDGSPRIILTLGSGVSEMFEIISNNNFKTIHNKFNKLEKIHNFKSYIVNEEHILTLYYKPININNNINVNNNENVNNNNNNNNDPLIDISIKDYLSLSIKEQSNYEGIKMPLKNLCLSHVKEKYENYIVKKTITSNNTHIYKLLNTFPKNIKYINSLNSYYIGYILGIKYLMLFNNNYKDNSNYVNVEDSFNNDYNFITETNSNINLITLEDLHKYIIKYKLNIQCLVDLYLGFLHSIPYKESFPICLNISIEILNNYNSSIITTKTLLVTILKDLFNLIGLSYLISNNCNTISHFIIDDEYNNYSILPIIIKPKGKGEYYGFELSGNGRFILSDRTITHNTVMGLKIAEELKVKTLILVHKEFLMNQWVERINEYLPEAKVGYIQGKKCDIQRKDIVLAMIQSLSDPRKDKDYPANLFESFGLVIADECHHLAARQFCRSLAKYPFKYTLGLSATPDRADGLQRVFKHYLGDIVYKDDEIQKTDEDIKLEHIPNSTVELYSYNNPDSKYTKEELNYQKKPNIVTMKSNVANCLKRTTFLLSFLPRLIEEGRTILILSCRRNHITEMETLINAMAIPNCSVGLYVGGMKQSNLDISAGKRVIIATYEMAEEAFDCKSLNTLIYGTPHKNIKQAVGRILREEKKKRKIIPLIIDLQDVFSSFNSWNKLREKYYKSEEYPMKLFNVIDKPELSFKPSVSFVRDVSNKKTTKTKANKDTKSKKSSFVIDMDDGDGDANDGGNDNGDNQENNSEIIDF